VLLVRRAASSVEPLTWAFPGGTPEFGEPLPAAVEREVREETGLSVTVGEVFWVGDLIDPAKPPGWHYAVIDFRCRVTGGVLRAGDDAIEARWVPLGDVHALELAQAMREVLRGIGASC
jgi:ADP-ribose pyrophosphatase YjhB (NUDIX family)